MSVRTQNRDYTQAQNAILDPNSDLTTILNRIYNQKAGGAAYDPVHVGGGQSARSAHLTGAATGAAGGAAAGASFGPWGALAGGVIGGGVGAFSGSGSHNGAAELAANQSAEDAARAQHGQVIQAIKQEMMRRKLTEHVNQSFHSQELGNLYDQLQNSVLQNSLADVVQQYDQNVRNAGFQTARQGLQGSSVDAERRGQAQQDLNTGAIQAAGQAQQFTQGVRDQNEQARQSLVSTISGGNPYQQQSLDQQTQAVRNQTSTLSQGFAQQAAQRQLSQYGLNMNSQALGNLLTTYGNLYKQGQVAEGNGKQGGGF